MQRDGKWKGIPPIIEQIGNKINIKPSQQSQDLSAIFAKAAPTNKDVITVLQAIWDRG